MDFKICIFVFKKITEIENLEIFAAIALLMFGASLNFFNIEKKYCVCSNISEN